MGVDSNRTGIYSLLLSLEVKTVCGANTYTTCDVQVSAERGISVSSHIPRTFRVDINSTTSAGRSAGRYNLFQFRRTPSSSAIQRDLPL